MFITAIIPKTARSSINEVLTLYRVSLRFPAILWAAAAHITCQGEVFFFTASPGSTVATVVEAADIVRNLQSWPLPVFCLGTLGTLGTLGSHLGSWKLVTGCGDGSDYAVVLWLDDYASVVWWLCNVTVNSLFYSWECCAVNSTEEVFTVHSGIAIRSMWTNCKWLLTHVIEVTQKSKSRFFFNIYWVFHCYCMIEFLNYKVAPLCCVVSVAVPSKLRSWCCLACAVVGSLDQ